MKNKGIALLILLSIVLYSCNCVETHLTKDEKAWFSAYEKGQTIIFKSNLGNLDTIEITKKLETHGNKNCNWLEIGTIQNHIISTTFKAKVCRNESYCDGGISISKYDVDEKAFPSFSLFGLFFSKSYNKQELKTDSVKLNTTNKIYSQVYHFENGVNANGSGVNPPKSFYWDKKEGLIKYETKDGEIFELLKK
jgi:hypothetical protein